MFNKADFSRLKKIVDKNCKYEFFRKINEYDDYYIATDGARIGILFKNKCEVQGNGNEVMTEKLKDFVKEIINNSKYDITIARRIVLSQLRQKYKEIASLVLDKTGEEIKNEKTIVGINFNYKNHELTLTVMNNSLTVKSFIVDIDYNRCPTKDFEIYLGCAFFIEYLEFFKGHFLKINYRNNPKKAIISEDEDKLMCLYPFAKKETLDENK